MPQQRLALSQPRRAERLPGPEVREARGRRGRIAIKRENDGRGGLVVSAAPQDLEHGLEIARRWSE